MNIVDKIKKGLSKNEKAEEVQLYKDLAPVDDINEKSEYFNALDWALSNKKIHNVALSGPYGAGKSSIIDSYLKNRCVKSIRVSLADFSGTEECKPEEIEKEFLKQLFYKVDYKTIPQSRYRKLHKISVRRIFGRVLFLELLLLLIIGIIDAEKIKMVFQTVLDSSISWGISEKTWYIVTLVVFLFVNIVLSRVLKWSFSKWKNWEINIADKAKVSTDIEKEESIFNRYLDEILYFFEETKYKVVFLEDLDRFNNVDIFVTLRELNQILNGYESIKWHITFVYAIRDDFFEDSKQRTKFFDYIIPVIPYINSTNSDDLLRRRLSEIKRAGVKIKIEDSYITQVAPYISDMRVLTSIVNEFLLYKKTQIDDKDLGLKDEKMFSLMIFKNLSPKDFAELESEQGIVKEALDCKKDFIKKKTEKLQSECDKLHELIVEADRDYIKNLEEIKASMLSVISGDCYVRSISINKTGESYSRSQIMSIEFDLTKLSGSTLTINRYNQNGNSSSISVQDINDFVNDGRTFIERWLVIKETEGEKKEKLKLDIEQKKNEIYNMKALKIKDIISLYGTHELFAESTNITDNNLLVFLLRNGFIDETYVNYINYFHPDSITAEEQSFILNVRNHGGVRDFNEVITHKSRVTERLLTHEFRQEEILNFDIVEFLLNSKEKTEKCQELMQLLSSRTNEAKEFIKRFIQVRESISKEFVRVLAEYNDYLWEDIFSDETIPDDMKDKYFDLIVSSSEIETIDRMNQATESSIVDYMCLYPDIFKRLRNASKNRVIELIKTLHIVFDDVLFESSEEEVIDYICDNNMYGINSTMFRRVLEYKNGNVAKDYHNANYTGLLHLEDDSARLYACDNIDEYLNEVVIKEGNNCESIEAILELSDLVEFDKNKTAELLKSQTIVFHSLDQILEYEDDENRENIRQYIDFCLDYSKVNIGWLNINAYYKKYGLSMHLLKQIIANIAELLLETEDEPNGLLMRDLLKEEWPLDSYRMLVQKYSIEPYDIPATAINEDQMKILIEEKAIPFNSVFARELAETYPSLKLSYFVVGKEELWDILNEMDASIIPVNEMILDSNFSIKEKKEILSMTDYSELTIEQARFIKDCKELIQKPYVQSAWQILPEEEKYELLVNHLSVFENEELPEMFESLASVYHSLATRTKHKVNFEKTPYNERLLTELKKKEYITSFSSEQVPDDTKAHLFTSAKKDVLVAWVKEKQN